MHGPVFDAGGNTTIDLAYHRPLDNSGFPAGDSTRLQISDIIGGNCEDFKPAGTLSDLFRN